MSKNGKTFWGLFGRNKNAGQTVPEEKKPQSDAKLPGMNPPDLPAGAAERPKDPGAAVPESRPRDPNATVPDRGPKNPGATVPEPEPGNPGATVPERGPGDPNATVPEKARTGRPAADLPPTVPESPLSFQKGELLLNSYRIDSEPIRGGMGSVWRVRHAGWGVDLAMKRPQPKMFADAASKSLFIDECRSWINLGLHPNIVSCYYVREIGGVPTIFSEWMTNGSLENRIEDGSLYTGSERELQMRLLDIAIQFARGLHYAHEAGLIHQDVKPDNLLLTEDWQAKVADFGLAKARAQLTVLEGARTELDPGATLNTPAGGYTPAYCSMEQMDGKPLTRRTDLYSWAVSLLEMYYGSRPWASGVAAGLNSAEYFRDCRVKLTPSLENLLTWCLAMGPDDRPHDFAVVEERLLEIWHESFDESYPRQQPKAAANTADSLNNRALSFLDLGMKEKAEALWAQALTSDPSHLDSLYNQGLLLWREARISDISLLERLKTARDQDRAKELADRIRQEEDAEALSALSAVQCAKEGQLCLSADGKRLILSDADGRDFRILDAKTGALLQKVETGGAETGLAVLPGREADIFWSSGADALVRYSIRDGEPTDFFANDSDRQKYFSFSLDRAETRAAVLLRERRQIGAWEVPKAEFWDIPGDRRLWSLTCDFGGRIYLTADGKRLAGFTSDSYKPSVEVWDTKQHKALFSLAGHTARILDLTVDDRFEFAYTVSNDCTLRKWNLVTQTCSRKFELEQMSGSEQLCPLPNGLLMILNSGEHHRIRFLDPESGRFFSVAGQHLPVQSCAAVDSRTGTAFFACEDGKIYRLRLPCPGKRAEASLSRIGNTEAFLARERAFRANMESAEKAMAAGKYRDALAFVRKAREQTGYTTHPDAIALARKLGSFCSIKGLRGVLKTTVMEGHESPPTVLAVRPDGRYAVSSCGMHSDRQILLWDLEEGIWVWQVSNPIRCSALAYSPDGKRVLAHVSDDISSFTVVEREGFNPDGKKYTPYARPEEEWHAGTSYVHSIYPAPDGMHFLAGLGQSFSVWKYGSKKPLLTKEVEDLSSLVLTPDGKTVLIGGKDHDLRRYRFPDGKELPSFRVQGRQLRVSPDGRLIAALSGQECRILDAGSGDVHAVLSVLNDEIPCCFSHDSRFLWCAGEDGEILLYSVDGGDPVSRIPGLSGKVTSLAADPTGVRLLAGCSDHRILNLELDWDYL